MRVSGLRALIVGLAMTAAATAPAMAEPVTVPTPAVSAELEGELAETYGLSEADFLQQEAQRLVEEALAQAGATPIASGAPVTVEVTILRAVPNRPTMEELRRRPGLSLQSIGVGGAELEAVIRNAAGEEIGRVRHEYFSRTIEEAFAASTWSDARSAMRRFARKVAEAYAEAV